LREEQNMLAYFLFRTKYYLSKNGENDVTI